MTINVERVFGVVLALVASQLSVMSFSDSEIARLIAQEAKPSRDTAHKSDINMTYLANTIRSISSHNTREEVSECWRHFSLSQKRTSTDLKNNEGDENSRLFWAAQKAERMTAPSRQSNTYGEASKEIESLNSKSSKKKRKSDREEKQSNKKLKKEKEKKLKKENREKKEKKKKREKF